VLLTDLTFLTAYRLHFGGIKISLCNIPLTSQRPIY